MPGQAPKKASDYIPYCEDQAMPYLAGAAKGGVAIQSVEVTADDANYEFSFAGEGLEPMADASYLVFVQNNTTAGGGTVANKTASGFDIAGLIAADVVSVLIVGRLSGQVG